MLAVPLVDNLIWLWIAVEATTLVSTLLVSYRNEKNSWEAAWKYLIITSTGIVFALLLAHDPVAAGEPALDGALQAVAASSWLDVISVLSSCQELI